MTTTDVIKRKQSSGDLRFDDHTDLTALGVDAEPHDWRLPANLPSKPKGLRLDAARPAVTGSTQEVSILHYQPDWRIWIVPTFSAILMLFCLGLVSFRLSIGSSVLLMLYSLVLTLLAWSMYGLRQQRLVVDRHGVSYRHAMAQDTLHQYPQQHAKTLQIPWGDLVGIASERCFAGRTLIVMSRHGVDHSIRIAYLPEQKADQLTRLLRTQLARRSHA